MAIVVFLFDKAEWDRAEVKNLSYADCIQATKEHRCIMQNIARLEDSVGEGDIDLFENYIRVYNDTWAIDMGGSGDSGTLTITSDGGSILSTTTTTTTAPIVTTTTSDGLTRYKVL